MASLLLVVADGGGAANRTFYTCRSWRRLEGKAVHHNKDLLSLQTLAENVRPPKLSIVEKCCSSRMYKEYHEVTMGRGVEETTDGGGEIIGMNADESSVPDACMHDSSIS